MPILIRCPSCDRALRVPDGLLGKVVKCPTCETKFTAAAEGEGVIEASPDYPRVPRTEEAIAEAPSRPGGRSSRSTPDEEDDEADERPRRRRRGRRWRYRSKAESAVTGPAVSLMVVGGLGIGIAILDLVLRLMGLGMMVANPGGAGDRPRDEGFRAGQIAGNTLGMAYDGVAVAWGILVLMGALQMKTLRNHGLALATCILALVPGNCCCILGLPFGIWGLVVLNREDVKEAFG